MDYLSLHYEITFISKHVINISTSKAVSISYKQGDMANTMGVGVVHVKRKEDVSNNAFYQTGVSQVALPGSQGFFQDGEEEREDSLTCSRWGASGGKNLSLGFQMLRLICCGGVT